MRIPLIFCTRKQFGFDYNTNTSETVTVSTTSGIPGYNWVFHGVPSESVSVTGQLSASSISFKISGKEFINYEGSNSGNLSISWQASSSVPASATPTGIYDEYFFMIRNYEGLPETHYPETVYEPIRLPILLDELLIGSNEIAEASTINTSIAKLYQNFEYLINKSEYISSSLWLSSRYGQTKGITSASAGNTNHFQWSDITYIPTETSAVAPPFYWAYDNLLSANHIAANSTSICYASDQDNLYVISTISGAFPAIYSRSYPIFSSDPFVDIRSINMDESGRITVLEGSGRISVLKYHSGIWDYVSSYSTLVEPIISPTNMTIRDGVIYITSQLADSASRYVVKAYDYDLNYIREYSNDKILSIKATAITRNYLVALAVDNLRTDVFYIFDKNTAEFIKAVPVGNAPQKGDKPTRQFVRGGELQKIFNATDDYMFFAISENIVHQYTQDGMLMYIGEDSLLPAIMGNPQFNSEQSHDNNIDYNLTGVAQDANYNIFACSNCDIIKYFGRPTHRSRIIDSPYFDFPASLWSLSELSIGGNENCSYWVYNRVFNRFMDNLNIYFNSLTGKLVISDNYADIVGFSPSELIPFTYPKSDIYVGVNELHCDAAINRNIRKLYANLELCAAYGQVQSDETIPGEEIFWDGQYTFNNVILYGGK